MAPPFGGNQAPPFGKKDFAKKGKKKKSMRKGDKSAPAQKALRMGGSMRGGTSFGK